MLSYEEFTEELVHQIPDYLPAELQERGLEVQSIVATNDTKRDALTPAGTSEGMSSKPVMYLDEIYRQYQEHNLDVQEMCRIVADEMKKSINRAPNPDLIDKQITLDHAFISMINLEANKEYLKSVPHLVYGDLAVVYKIPVSEKSMGQGAVTITKSLMEKKGWSPELLFISACENMRNELLVTRMEDTLFPEPGAGKTEFGFDELSDLPESETNMFVVSNRSRFWGDGVFLMQEELGKLSEKLDASLVVIPSSVHETIVVPDRGDGFAKDCLVMVKEVNQSTVDPKEQLSDSIYRFDRDSQKLERYGQDGSVQEMKLVNPEAERKVSDRSKGGSAR